jgi:hypothetical protein
VGKAFNRRQWRKAVRYSAFSLAAIVVLLVAAGFLLRALLDRPEVEAEIQSRLSRAVDGQIAWESLQVRLLPSPRAVVRGVRIELPGTMSARAEQLDARLRLMPLFRGRAEIASIGVSRPVIQIDLAPSSPAEKKKKGKATTDPFDAYRSAVGAVVGGLGEFTADTELEIENAAVEVRAPGVPAIQLRDLSIHARTGVKGLDIEAAAAGNFLDKLKLSARIEFDNLAGSASLEAAGLKPQVWLDRYLAKSPVSVVVPAANLRAQIRTDGKISFDGKVDARAETVEILHSGERVRLPGPVNLAGVSVTVSRKGVKVDRAALSMLDADALASATITYGKELRVEGAVSEAKVGEKFLAWIWPIADLPPHLALKAPIRVAARRIAWSPKQALDLEATAGFDTGPGVSIDLNWVPGALNIRRAALKDGRSDAAIALRIKGRAVEGSFSGSLGSTSIESMLQTAKLPSGSASGDLRFAFDRDKPGRGTAQGNLKGVDIDLASLLRRPVKIERVDLAADNTTLRISEASVIWAGQRAALRGEVRRGEGAPVIDAQIDSAGIVVDALLPSKDEPAAKAPSAAEAPPADWDSRLWPLPVTGRIAVRSDFVKYGAREFAPLAGTLALESQRARLDLTQARLCGISLPLTLEATPKGASGSVRLSAQKQQLEKAVQCLSNEGVLITGEFDLKADLATRGKVGEFTRNLEGTVSAEVRDGTVRKFALLGNILSLRTVSDLFEKDGTKLEKTGFPYRRIVLKGRFQEGRFVVEESGFHSSAVGLAATGWISVIDFKTKLSVLVAPFGRLDQIVRKVPIVGYVIGGTLTSVPVGVSGDIRDPLVVPLGPEVVTSELAGIFTRTLKLPANILAPLNAKPGAGVPPERP